MTFKTFGITGRMRTNTKADFFLHAVRLQESEINFVFCERVLYVGTAHSQKAKSAKITLNTTFKVIFYKCYFSYQYGKRKSAIRQTLLSLRDISPVRGISLALRFQFMIFKHGTV